MAPTGTGGCSLRYPDFEVMATTLRTVHTAIKNDWSAIAWSGGEVYGSEAYSNLEIFDRACEEDSFASGLIYGIMGKEDAAQTGRPAGK